MVNVEELLSIPFVEHKGQKIHRVYQIITSQPGVTTEIFRRIINVENSVEDSLRVVPYGIEIAGSYPDIEKRMNQGKGGRCHGRIGLIINGSTIGERGWENYLVTFQHTIDACMDGQQPKPDLVDLLKDLLIFPPIFEKYL